MGLKWGWAYFLGWRGKGMGPTQGFLNKTLFSPWDFMQVNTATPLFFSASLTLVNRVSIRTKPIGWIRSLYTLWVWLLQELLTILVIYMDKIYRSCSRRIVKREWLWPWVLCCRLFRERGFKDFFSLGKNILLVPNLILLIFRSIKIEDWFCFGLYR